MARAGQESIRFRSSQEPAREYSTFSIQCKLSLICMEVAQLFQATEVHQSCSEMMPSFETRKAAFRNTCVHHRHTPKTYSLLATINGEGGTRINPVQIITRTSAGILDIFDTMQALVDLHGSSSVVPGHRSAPELQRNDAILRDTESSLP
ncbi:hypothetical protein e1116g03.tmp0111 [Eimeria tenella]|uniref:Uncharacterized protein n=1 Tax=Eimeria tenella TaxID=5802 RepID=C8TE44_EIMTE|nr:hypothetical protein e1116g03.tmp0111 [Eimeria tenella]